MAVKWGVHLTQGFVGLIITFIVSIVNNTWVTSLLRGGFGYILFFSISLVWHFFIQSLANKRGNEKEKDRTSEEKNYNTNPELDDSTFQAIPLSSLHNMEHNLSDPEEIADTIRTWTK